MKLSVFSKLSASLALVVLTAVLLGCTPASSGGGGRTDPCAHTLYGGKAMEPYADTAHKFAICVPKGLTKTGPAGTSDGSVVFSGFAVPAGTNLISKTLTIVAGAYPDGQSATAFGQFTAGGVTFKRTRFDEGSAGHTHLHIIYTAKVGGNVLHFDFLHNAVNPLNFDPGNRPAAYDEAAQIKLTEVIMGTFRQTP